MKGVIYARYSSDNQREESIEGQICENTAYANKNGIDIVGTYIYTPQYTKRDLAKATKKLLSISAKVLSTKRNTKLSVARENTNTPPHW